MNFELSEIQENVRAMVHWFAENEIRPIALEADRAHQVPMSFLRKVKDTGISMGPLPKDFGDDVGEKKDKKGVRKSNRIEVIGAEEMAWGDPAVILTLPGPGLGGPPISFMGT